MEPPWVKTDFLAVGANRNPQGAEWDVESGLVAFAAGSCLGIWRPEVRI
jgi:hypothetical protein